ncbi:hypothetical protein BDR26DRAFT_870324 [Obelidium mucronatum]|nr:hypothetical protein BDR26DRAFT_870324 [Obelidium mucronatum]
MQLFATLLITYIIFTPSAALGDHAHDTPATASSIRCGLNFDDANNSCGPTCSTNIACPSGLSCHTGLKVDICDPRNDPSRFSGQLTSRCGYSWDDANDSCRHICSDANGYRCPNQQTCYGNLKNLRVCWENRKNSDWYDRHRGGGGGDGDNRDDDGDRNRGNGGGGGGRGDVSGPWRCGRTWTDANRFCGQTCFGVNDNSCPAREQCFGNLNARDCSVNGSTGNCPWWARWIGVSC